MQIIMCIPSSFVQQAVDACKRLVSRVYSIAGRERNLSHKTSGPERVSSRELSGPERILSGKLQDLSEIQLENSSQKRKRRYGEIHRWRTR